MSDHEWQECRERFTARCEAVKELTGGAPHDSRTESLKGESNSREVANGEGTASSQQMSDHAKVTEEDRNLYRSLLTEGNPEWRIQLLADARRDARVQEAEWWAASIDPYNHHAPACAARIEQLKRGEV